MRSRLGEAGASADLVDVLTNLIVVMLGGNARPTREAFTALGWDSLVRDQIDGIGPVVDKLPAPEIGPRLDQLNLDRLEKTALESSLSELEHARDTLRFVHEFATVFSSVTSRTTGVNFGYQALAEWSSNELEAALIGVPAMLLLFELPDGPTVHAGLAEWRTWLPAYTAASHLLDELPERWHRFLSPSGPLLLASAPADDQEQFNRAIRTWIETHPTEANLMASKTDTK
jgi:hypothetical protein